MSQTMYRAAVAGLGFIGAGDQVSGDALGQRVENLPGTHAQSLTAHPRVDLVAGSSRDPGRRNRFTERTGGVRTYEQWAEMLEEQTPDIVSVATYSPYHAEVTIACARAGVRCVYCEKPVATSLRDADAMLEACAEHSTLLVVNHSRRWDPLYLEASRLISEGAVGDVHHLLVQWPGGRLGNVGTHVFDAVRLLLGRDARAVAGGLDDTGRPDCRGSEFHDPGGWGVISFDGGIRVFVDASESIDAPVPLSIEVAGSTGELRIHGFDASTRKWGREWAPIAIHADGRNSADRAVAEIVDCLDTGSPPSSSGEDGRQALEMIMGFHASAGRGVAGVELPLSGADREIRVEIG